MYMCMYVMMGICWYMWMYDGHMREYLDDWWVYLDV